MALTSLSGVKEAKQQRSQATQEAIFDAALAEIREKGTEGFTLADVVRRADCTTGAVYSRFRNKEALLFALYKRIVEGWKRALERGYAKAATQERSLRQELKRLFAAQIANRRRDWQLRNAFLARIVTDDAYRHVSAEMMSVSVALLTNHLARRREFREVAVPELRRRIGLLSVVIGASIERAISFGSMGVDFLPKADEELVDEFCSIALAILQPNGD